MINFGITEQGLVDQMLSLVVSIEKRELEEERNALIEANASNIKKLLEKEDLILDSLKNTNPDEILDDDDIITQLSVTKKEANLIKQAQEKTKLREDQIMEERSKYIDIAIKSTLIFFSVTDMINVNYMYQFSLKWFKQLFEQSSTQSEKSTELNTRIDNI